MKKLLIFSSIIAIAGIATWYFFIKEPVFKATNGFLVNLNDKGVIIEGYDAVSYFTNKKPAKGTEQYKTEYNGASYWFASDENLRLFKKEPAKYAPQYGAFCGYAVSIGKLRPVNPEVFQIENGRLILQHTQEAYELFNINLQKSIDKADMKWPGLVASHVDKPVQYDKPATAAAVN
jgi:YHS domain-containing protein